MAPILTHEKTGRSVDVEADQVEYYEGHGWKAGEPAADQSEGEAKAAAEAEQAKAEAEAKTAADAKKGSDDAGTDSGEGAAASRKTTSRSANTKD